MAKSEMTDAAARACVHEAGHAVACLCLGIPLSHVSGDPANPHLHRARYQPAHDAGLECLVTLCLAGPVAEAMHCGAITDGGDEGDYQMARHYLAHRCGPLQIGTEIDRLRDAAARLLKTEWASRSVHLIADALRRRRTLSAADIEALLWRTAA
jgi:hypothetical protein